MNPCYPGGMRFDIFAFIFSIVMAIGILAFQTAYPHIDTRLALDALWFAIGLGVGTAVTFFSANRRPEPVAVKSEQPKPVALRLPTKPTPVPDYGFDELADRLKDLCIEHGLGEDMIQNLEDTIDLEIGDKVIENAITVWARLGDLPKQKLSSIQLHRARFKSQTGILQISNDWGKTTAFTDVAFNKAEVDKVWSEPLKPNQPPSGGAFPHGRDLSDPRGS